MSEDSPDRSRGFLVAGVAGFIGFQVARRLLEAGERVVGIDCREASIFEGLQARRLSLLRDHTAFTFALVEPGNFQSLRRIADDQTITHALHLPAQNLMGGRDNTERLAQMRATFLAAVLGVFWSVAEFESITFRYRFIGIGVSTRCAPMLSTVSERVSGNASGAIRSST